MKGLKIVFIGALLMLLVSGAAFSQTIPEIPDLNDLNKTVDGFAKEIHESVPFYSTLGLNWSDAYIGKFFPSLPPHFGIGLTTGFTTFGSGSVKKVLGIIDQGDKLPDFLEDIGLPMLGYTVEARLGGIILPFDVGVKLGILPLEGWGFAADYLLVGADIRYALLDKPILPKVSVGIGYYHLKGGIRFPLGDGLELDVPSTSHELKLGSPKMGFLWGTDTFELKVQVSFRLPFITPYAGAGLSMSTSHAGYEFRSTVSVNGEEGIPTEVIDALKNMGIAGISQNGFEYINEKTSFNMRLFGGISLNLTIIRFDINVLYNMTGGQFGASFGTRIQI